MHLCKATCILLCKCFTLSGPVQVSAELSHSMKDSDHRRNTSKSVQTPSESLCACCGNRAQCVGLVWPSLRPKSTPNDPKRPRPDLGQPQIAATGVVATSIDRRDLAPHEKVYTWMFSFFLFGSGAAVVGYVNVGKTGTSTEAL